MKVEIYFLLSSLLTAFAYSYLDHRIITDVLVLFMLKSFCIFTDFGLFLAIGSSVDFKRGICIVYLFKIIVFMAEDIDQLDLTNFILKVIMIPFGLVLYYKITLFLIMLVLSFVV